MSSLAFPLLQNRLDKHYLSREKIPHLGQIQDHAKSIVSDSFQDFLLLPRRLRYSMQNILLGQYRLTPLHKKRATRKRIPRDGDFHLALQFLSLRTLLEPALQTVYDEWNKLYQSAGSPVDEERPKRRRRPRRRRKAR